MLFKRISIIFCLLLIASVSQQIKAQSLISDTIIFDGNKKNNLKIDTLIEVITQSPNGKVLSSEQKVLENGQIEVKNIKPSLDLSLLKEGKKDSLAAAKKSLENKTEDVLNPSPVNETKQVLSVKEQIELDREAARAKIAENQKRLAQEKAKRDSIKNELEQQRLAKKAVLDAQKKLAAEKLQEEKKQLEEKRALEKELLSKKKEEEKKEILAKKEAKRLEEEAKKEAKRIEEEAKKEVLAQEKKAAEDAKKELVQKEKEAVEPIMEDKKVDLEIPKQEPIIDQPNVVVAEPEPKISNPETKMEISEVVPVKPPPSNTVSEKSTDKSTKPNPLGVAQIDNQYGTVRLAYDELSTSFLLSIPTETKMHYHNNHSENIILVEGEGIVIMGYKTVTLRKNELVFITKGTPHKIINKGKGKLKILSIQSPFFDGTDTIILE